MPYKEFITEKVYWTIGEVADMIHRETSTLRFWGTEFDWLTPKKDKKGNRQYVRDDLDKVFLINFLVRKGMTLEGIRDVYKNEYAMELAEFFANKERKCIRDVQQYPLYPEECFSLRSVKECQ